MTPDTPPPPGTPPQETWPDTPPALWRTVAGFALFSVLYVVLVLVWTVLLPPARTPAGQTLSVLGSFSAGLAALALMLQILHQRGLLAVLGPAGPALRQGWLVFRAVALLHLLLWFVPMPEEMTPRPNLPAGQWLALLPLALPLLLIQVGTEEALFRGYLQSRLAARFRSPLFWLVLPSVFFALLHYRADSDGNAMIFLLSAGAFGLAAADLTARAGTLGPAIALHLVNNIVAVLLASLNDGLGGLALYHLPLTQDDPLLQRFVLVDLGTLLVGWLAARVALRR